MDPMHAAAAITNTRIPGRAFISGAGPIAATAVFRPIPLLAQTAPSIPQRPSMRLIIDNDSAGDPDGLIALAHQLLSTRRSVKRAGADFRYGEEVRSRVIRVYEHLDARLIPPDMLAAFRLQAHGAPAKPA